MKKVNVVGMSATMKPILGAAIFLGLMMSGVPAQAQSNRELHEPIINAPLEPLPAGIGESQIFAKMLKAKTRTNLQR